MSEAQVIKRILDYAGISSCVVPIDVEDPGAPTANFRGQFEIKVLERDYQCAKNAILPYQPELFATYPESAPKIEEETDYIARCPRCGCPDIIFQNVDSQTVRGLQINRNYTWTCDGCGHHWQDEGDEERGRRVSGEEGCQVPFPSSLKRVPDTLTPLHSLFYAGLSGRHRQFRSAPARSAPAPLLTPFPSPTRYLVPR